MSKQYGTSSTSIALEAGTQAFFAGESVILRHDVVATVEYSWDNGYAGSCVEPPEPQYFGIIGIVIKENAVWTGRSSAYYTSANNDVIAMFSGEALADLENTIEQHVCCNA